MANKSWLTYFAFVLIQLLIAFYSQNYLLTDDLYRLIIGAQMSDRQFGDYLEFVHKLQWVGYLFIPLALLLRISFAWLCLKAGSFVTERFTQVAFWKICVQAEMVFAIGAVAGLLYTILFVKVETMQQLSINPFSLELLVSQSVPKWTSYFFNTLNIFELGYILFLAYQLAAESKKQFLPSLRFVASAYLPGLAFWVILITYLSVVFQS